MLSLIKNAPSLADAYRILNSEITNLRNNINSEEDEWIINHKLKQYEWLMDEIAKEEKMAIKVEIKKLIQKELRLGLCKNQTLVALYNMGHNQNEAIQNQSKKLWFWLTINPDWKKITIENFKKKIIKLTKKKSIKEYYIVLEQRCDIGIEKYQRDRRNRKKHNELMMKSIHAHILLKRDIDYKGRKFCKFAGDIKNTFKDCITSIYKKDEKKRNSFSEPVFNYWWLSPEMLNDKMNYIKGLKQIKEKNIKQELDDTMREIIKVPKLIDINNISILQI